MRGPWPWLAGAVIALVAAAGWWRAVSLSDELAVARADRAEQRDAVQSLVAEQQQAQDELSELMRQRATMRARLERAALTTHILQGCIHAVADHDDADSQDVRFGFITPVDGSRDLIFDPAEWFIGDAATAQARAAGEIGPRGRVPNDYFIRNSTREASTFPVGSEAVIVTTTMDRRNIPSPKCVRWPRFVRAALHSPQPWRSRVARSPYWLTIEDGYVVEMLEQYVP